MNIAVVEIWRRMQSVNYVNAGCSAVVSKNDCRSWPFCQPHPQLRVRTGRWPPGQSVGTISSSLHATFILLSSYRLVFVSVNSVSLAEAEWFGPKEELNEWRNNRFGDVIQRRTGKLMSECLDHTRTTWRRSWRTDKKTMDLEIMSQQRTTWLSVFSVIHIC